MKHTENQDIPPKQTSMLNFVELPAGSGKTTQVEARINQHRREHPHDNILAITFTNRAADALNERFVGSPRVDISTIHSFVEQQLNPVFESPEVIEQYFDRYGSAIKQYLTDGKHTTTITRYRDKFGDVSLHSIKEHTHQIRYARRRYGSKLYSTLGHDDLLDFFNALCRRFTMLRQRIGRKYQLIIVDECQDTDPGILRTLADISMEFSVPLWVYGDMMQQLFNDDEPALQLVLNRFDRVQQPIVNHRSRPRIVSMLNTLSNDPCLLQAWDHTAYPMEDESADRDSTLELIISNDVQHTVQTIQAVKHNEHPLSLVLFNKERFEQYGLSKLFEAYSASQQFGFDGDHSVTDVMLPGAYDEAIDDIDSYMLQLVHIGQMSARDRALATFHASSERSERHLFGQRFNEISNRSPSPLRHGDLVAFMKDFQQLIDCLTNNSTVEDLMELAESKRFIDTSWYAQLIQDSKIYEHVKSVPCSQFVKQYELIQSPDARSASTQHGVKGESHESIIFAAEDSLRYEPRISMYDCIALLSSTEDFNLRYIKDRQQQCADIVERYFQSGVPFLQGKNITPYLEEHTERLCDCAQEIWQLFSTSGRRDESLHRISLSGVVKPLLTITSPSKKNREKLGRLGPIFVHLIAAFRILYVGCSRARSTLRIVLDKKQLEQHHCEQQVIDKFTDMGFTIVPTPTPEESNG
ncbi:UvrD-helicase domain-containing protein [Bifidobacterium mongoliense]|uniref:UvrD-helicase domain-containing protein n=1 Tax=Bifidobacterium mongoliense TaxID=518643 RepID=UPI0030ED7A99